MVFNALKCAICGRKMHYKVLYDRYACKCGTIVSMMAVTENINSIKIFCRKIPITFTLNNKVIYRGKLLIGEEQ